MTSRRGKYNYHKSKNGVHGEGIERIVAYSLTGEVTHLARQRSNGVRTSKIGESFFLEYELYILEGARNFSKSPGEVEHRAS